jgi:hypothetical protein
MAAAADISPSAGSVIMDPNTVIAVGDLLKKLLRRSKRLVIVESPYAGELDRNIAYARAAVRDSLLRGESPIASHLLYTQDDILKDWVPEERKLGIEAGLAWRHVADASVVYTDFGLSSGMKMGIETAQANGLKVEYRNIGDAIITFHSKEFPPVAEVTAIADRLRYLARLNGNMSFKEAEEVIGKVPRIIELLDNFKRQLMEKSK